MMIAFCLVALFTIATSAALLSLADSVVRFRNAWSIVHRDLVGERARAVTGGRGAVVMLHPAPAGQVNLPQALAAAA